MVVMALQRSNRRKRARKKTTAAAAADGRHEEGTDRRLTGDNTFPVKRDETVSVYKKKRKRTKGGGEEGEYILST